MSCVARHLRRPMRKLFSPHQLKNLYRHDEVLERQKRHPPLANFLSLASSDLLEEPSALTIGHKIGYCQS